MSARSALEELDFAALLAELRNQETKGHTAESDLEIPLEAFGDKAHHFAAELADVLRRGDRRNLDVAYRRAARLAAFALSAMRRIQTEPAPCNTPEDPPCPHPFDRLQRRFNYGLRAYQCNACGATIEEREIRNRWSGPR